MTRTILIPALAVAALGLSACGKTETAANNDTTLILNDEGEAGLDNAAAFDADAVGDNVVVPEANGADAVLANTGGNAL